MRGLQKLGLAWIITALWSVMALAQSAEDVVWVQVEAHPSLATAQSRAELYGGRLEDVNGFSIGGGWYGVVLGPYRRVDAEQVLRVYRSEGSIPRDSYITLTSALREQFFPQGVDILGQGVVTAATQPATTTEPEPPQPVAEAPKPTPVIDETKAQARRSEQLLSKEERMDLQIALQWAGYYNSAIDGAFGRGTRGSMAAWQEDNGYDATGILTTLQRAALIDQYNAVLNGLGLRLVRDDKAGIEMKLPTGVVAFDKVEYPFSHYTATGDIQAQVLLISQAGDQTTLFGLYDIMQTLEIVPLDGKRDRKANGFTLTGENSRIISHTEVGLQDGQIKGFTLVWPAGDEERRTRLLAEMRKSFERIDGVIDPSWSDSGDQDVDLVSGLQVRKPRLSRSGFFVTSSGSVVTTTEAVQSCTRITLDDETEARLAATNEALGVAILEPQSAIAPRAVAQFSNRPPRLKSEIAVSGFSYGGVLGAPTMSFGAFSDLRGLRGEEELSRLDVAALEGDAGGPVFDQTGGVMGMLLPRAASGRQLPAEVQFAADADVIRMLLEETGIQAQSLTDGQGAMPPEDITTQARDVTVLVSCWD